MTTEETTNPPSAEAIALAVKLSGHTHCQRTLTNPDSLPLPLRTPCDGCLGDAQTIDRELALPQRNAALRCAQGVVDDASEFGQPPQRKERPYIVSFDVIEQLRDALAAIRTK